MPKNLCFQIVVLEKTLESPLDCKEINPVHPKDQSCIFIGRTDAEAETPILWPPDAKNWLILRHCCWERLKLGGEGDDRDEMAGWHHWLDGRESEWTPGVGDRQGGLACCDSWVAKSRRRLSNGTELNWKVYKLHLIPSIFVFYLSNTSGFRNTFSCPWRCFIVLRIISLLQHIKPHTLDLRWCQFFSLVNPLFMSVHLIILIYLSSLGNCRFYSIVQADFLFKIVHLFLKCKA